MFFVGCIKSILRTWNSTGLNGLGDTGEDREFGIAVDGSGNVYVIGHFRGDTAIFGSTTLTNAGSYDIFIAKLNVSGDFLWAKQAGGSSYDYGYGIAVDSSGNVYVTGDFSDTATFGSATLTSLGWGDIFIAKLNDSGDFLWAKQAGGYCGVMGLGIAVDGSGNVYVTGWFRRNCHIRINHAHQCRQF